MEFVLTYKSKHAEHCSDGKDRNIIKYFLNDILIFEQKLPFDESFDYGFEQRTDISDIFLFNGYLYQTRNNSKGKTRMVKFPISKKILQQFNIPNDFKISINN
jgi:hypothetical protein